MKTSSLANRKDYENYVINRIWSLLDDPEIKPVSQWYALIDLYFPQLNIGIECNEFHHTQTSKFLGIFRKTGKVKTLTINDEEKEFTIHKMVSDIVNSDSNF